MNTFTTARFFLSTIALLAALVLVSPAVKAQSQFEVTIQQFSSDEVRGYVQPMVDMFGANINAGLYHSAAIPKHGFHIRVDVIGMVSVVSDEHRKYDASLPSGFVPMSGSYKTSTVFGGKGTTFKDVRSGLEYKGSDGVFSTNVFPLFVPQATIGTFFGTEATVRYLTTPPLSGGKLPSSTLWGVGVRHSLSQYFGNDPPLDAAIGGFYSNFALGDLMEISASAIDLQLSKSFSLLTLYSGIAIQQSSVNLHYTYRATEASSPKLVDLSLKGANNFRLTTGLQIDLQAIKLFADANFGYVQHFSGGVGFGF